MASSKCHTLVPIKMSMSSLTTMPNPRQTLSFSTIGKEQPLFKSVTRLNPVFRPVSRCGIFPMAQNVNTIKLDQIEIFCGKTCSIHKILKIYTNIVTYVFLSRPSTDQKKTLKKNCQHKFFAIFLSKAKTKIIKKITLKQQIC